MIDVDTGKFNFFFMDDVFGVAFNQFYYSIYDENSFSETHHFDRVRRRIQ